MEYRIGLIHGDGIGPEIVDEAKKVLDAVCEKYGRFFKIIGQSVGYPKNIRLFCIPVFSKIRASYFRPKIAK